MPLPPGRDMGILNMSIRHSRMPAEPWGYHKEMSAATPNPEMMIPEMRLTQRKLRRLNRSRSALTPKLKTHHQSADPRKTPRTIPPASI